MTDWKASVLSEAASFELSKEEYDYLVGTNLLPRVTEGSGPDSHRRLVGFYTVVDVVLPMLEEDLVLSEDEVERDMISSILKKIRPFIGKTFFIP